MPIDGLVPVPSGCAPVATAASGGDKRRWVDTIEAALLARRDRPRGAFRQRPSRASSPSGLEIAAAPAARIPVTRSAEPPRASRRSHPARGSAPAVCAGRRSCSALRDDLDVSELHGNLYTRLGRLAAGDFDVIVLAVAGLRRLGRARLEPERRARSGGPGQGTLAIEARIGDERLAAAPRRHSATPAPERALEAQRALVSRAGRELRHAGRRATRERSKGGVLELRTFIGARRRRRVDSRLHCAARIRARSASRPRDGCSTARRRDERARRLRRRRAGGPRTDDRAGAGADRGRRRDPPRPPDPASALDGARPEAELLFVGKEGGGPSVPQQQIEELLVEHARAGGMVVRLKGGDPFVFGRGGEEALTLRTAGIPFEVVPGVTAGIAAPAYAGIPVTQRASPAPWPSSPVTRTRPRLRARSIGRRSRPSRGRSCCTWGLPAGALIAAALIAAGRPRLRAGGGRQAGTLPGQRTVRGDPRGDRGARWRRPACVPGDHDRGTPSAAGRGDRLARVRSAGRAYGGGDARAGTGRGWPRRLRALGARWSRRR